LPVSTGTSLPSRPRFAGRGSPKQSASSPQARLGEGTSVYLLFPPRAGTKRLAELPPGGGNLCLQPAAGLNGLASHHGITWDARLRTHIPRFLSQSSDVRWFDSPIPASAVHSSRRLKRSRRAHLWFEMTGPKKAVAMPAITTPLEHKRISTQIAAVAIRKGRSVAKASARSTENEHCAGASGRQVANPSSAHRRGVPFSGGEKPERAKEIGNSEPTEQPPIGTSRFHASGVVETALALAESRWSIRRES